MLAQKILSLIVYSFDWGCGSNFANRYNLILSSTQKKEKEKEKDNEVADPNFQIKNPKLFHER